MPLQNLRGRVAFMFDEIDFDVDQIVGVKNMKTTDIAELGKAAMQSYDPEFSTKVRPGDVVVGNHNFGYGHPHYPPMKALRYLGIAGVIAESFSPGYWRGHVRRWDEIEVDWSNGEVRNLNSGKAIGFEPLSRGDQEMLAAGGLEKYLIQRARDDKRMGAMS